MGLTTTSLPEILYEVIEQEFSVPVKWGFPWEVVGGGGEIPIQYVFYIANAELHSIV